MNDQTLWNRRFALFGLRLTIASMTMLVGYHKIIAAPLDEQYRFFVDLEQWFPVWVLVAVNYYTAYVELIAGFMLLIGFMRDISLYLILSVLVIVAFGHSLEHLMWDMSQVVFREMLLVTLLLLPATWDIIRFDICFAFTRKLSGLDKTV